MTSYTRDDVGCYVDNARGIYDTDAIVGFARAHGAVIERDCDCDHSQSILPSEFASCEFASEFEDDATDYMNENFAVDGCYWGRNDSCDWGLWKEDDYA